jgi:hypothetical protein
MTQAGIDISLIEITRQKPDVQAANIANCNTNTEAPVAATARSPCPIRVMKLMVLMCAYSIG